MRRSAASRGSPVSLRILHRSSQSRRIMIPSSSHYNITSQAHSIHARHGVENVIPTSLIRGLSRYHCAPFLSKRAPFFDLSTHSLRIVCDCRKVGFSWNCCILCRCSQALRWASSQRLYNSYMDSVRTVGWHWVQTGSKVWVHLPWPSAVTATTHGTLFWLNQTHAWMDACNACNTGLQNIFQVQSS